ncbi:MAG: thiosulfate oxidation carrier protein SoxY [Acidiferrobacterales bacterium]|nr:thiosulfate oxidation carrier protein SoxY [Acidiferrobacterales bacterium]
MGHSSYRSVAERRSFLKLLGVAGVTASAAALGIVPSLKAAPLGAVQPEETVEATLKRLFGNRTLNAAGNKIKLDLPLIAENGAVVPIKIDANLPMAANNYVKSIYIIADKNRRPLNARVNFTPDAGKAYFAANIRLGKSGNVRAIAEMSDGTLYQAIQDVKVTRGGCGG